MNHIQSKPTRLWFLARGYRQADTCHTNGYVLWLHPKTNDVLNQHGQKTKLQLVPFEKHHKNTTRYLKLGCTHGNMLLARLKYLTFIGPIPKGHVIDHIDGDTLNNNINNLRAVPRAINDRDGGFMRKLRNNGINVAAYPDTIILRGYEHMAIWRAHHSERKYKNLNHDTLLQIFLGKEDKL